MVNDWIKAGAIVLLSAAALPAAEPAAILTGIAKARDGDDIVFGQVAVRLQGIAAPEWSRNQRDPGGRAAARNLARIVDGQRVTCHLDGTTAGRAGRPAAVCFLRGQDIGALQVRAGHARDCPAFSGGRYAAEERAARAAGRDLRALYPLPGYCGPDRTAAIAD